MLMNKNEFKNLKPISVQDHTKEYSVAITRNK